MADSREIQSIQKITHEVDESQAKIIYGTHCLKAQEHLNKKLKDKLERYKEHCGFICQANLKLQAEITQAQQEKASLLAAENTIRAANVDLYKELLMTQEQKQELIERINNGEKKYNDSLNESKARYESLPHVQKLLKAKEEVINMKDKIFQFENEENKLLDEMKAKKEACRAIDCKRVVEVAKFMVHERPKLIEGIIAKSAAVKEIEKELSTLQLSNDNEGSSKLKEGKDDAKTDTRAWIMPSLQLNYLDYDNLESLDKIKDAVDNLPKTPEKTYSIRSLIVIDPTKTSKKKSSNVDDYILHTSLFVHKSSASYDTQNYSNKKLINILEDIKINKHEAQKMIKVVNPDALQIVNTISVDDRQAQDKRSEIRKDSENDKIDNEIEYEEIEEVDLTASNAENIVKPPSQYMDFMVSPKEYAEPKASTSKISQEEPPKKRVSFDLANNVETKCTEVVEKSETSNGFDANNTINSQLNVSDDGFVQMKDMIMKKHNLDLSPQFAYPKNIMTPLNIKKPEDTVVISKFFPQEKKQINADDPSEIIEKVTEDDQKTKAATPKKTDNNSITEIDIVVSPNKQNMDVLEKPKSGFMLGQSTPVIADSLEDSISTTGFLEGDGDFQPGLDASLLLSPKANYAMPTVDTQEVLSQDVPNFFSGLAKTGLSFFERLNASESKPDSSAQNQGFSFNFGGQEKKSRSGPFSMFQ